MLKYYDIINQISDSDKIRMLCDAKCVSDEKYSSLGIPTLNIASIEDLGRDKYPSPGALANTWDTSLIGEVADELIKESAEDGAGFLKMPPPRIRINPYRAALSEDPLLASSVSRSYLTSAERAGVSAGLGGFGIFSDETEWLDETPNERFINEYLAKPYADAADGVACAAIITEQDVATKNYEWINSDLSEKVSKGKIVKDAVAVCDTATAEKAVLHISSGGILFNGPAFSLESALARYKQMKKEIEEGTSTAEDLNAEISKGKAISPEAIDEALDRLFAFSFEADHRAMSIPSPENSELGLRAAAESAVLLKNSGSVLPLNKKAKISVIGDISEAFELECKALLEEKGYTVIGMARGYDLRADRSEELLNEAFELAKRSDTVLLFLGLGEERASRTHKTSNIAIPANQQELLETFEAVKEKTVALMPSDVPSDVGIPDNCAAILTAVFNTKYSARALTDILTGERSPSGKLANTVYFDTESRYEEHKIKTARGDFKVGPFVGYRYYDASGENVGFPFGHGLSYVNFKYSDIAVGGGFVRLTLKNTGKLTAAETVQVYIGKNDSAVIRPLKELCGFKRAELAPGEEKTLEIPYKIPTVYQTDTDGFAEERGDYTVYVGASSSDIKSIKNITLGKGSLVADNEKISDYIHTESNIISDNFKLEAKFKTMKRSVFNFIVGGVSLVLALILKMFCVFAELYYVFLDAFAVILAVMGVIFFIVEAVRRNRMYREEKRELDRINADMFDGAEQIPVYSAEKIFSDEFDAVKEETVDESENVIVGIGEEYFEYIDREQTFARAANDFLLYAGERGAKFSPDDVKKIFASLSASRLAVVYGMNDGDFNDFMQLLAGYFSTGLFVDIADGSYTVSKRVLYSSDDDGNPVKTNINAAIDSATKNLHTVHFAALTGVKCESLPLYFSSFVGYVKNPAGRLQIKVTDSNKVESYCYIPENLWFVLNLAEGESFAELPTFVSEVATVNDFAFEKCEKAMEYTAVRKFSYYQLDYLASGASSKLLLDEALWKKVDSIEEYVNGYVPFSIGNKLWLCLEKYTCIYMACGGDAAAALDEAVASKLMPRVISLLQDKISADEKSLAETVGAILGEDSSVASKTLSEKFCLKKA